MAPKKKATKAQAKKRSSAVFEDFAQSDGHGVSDQTNIETYTPKSAMTSYSQTPSIGSDDVFIPKLRLAQGLTTEVQNGIAKPGQWLVAGEDPLDEVTIIPMMMNRRRELRDNDEDARPVLCRSNDGEVGVGNPGGQCSTCPMSKWVPGKGKNAKNAPPPCTFIYSYVVYVVEYQSVVILEFYRTSIPAGKMLNTFILQKGLGNFAALLTSTGSKGTRGTYYAPSVSGSKVDKKTIESAQRAVTEMFGSA